MAKKLFKKYLPDPKKIKDHKHLKMLGSFIHDPNLWHLNRTSVARAFSVGLFCAWIPVPFQMLLSASIAILVKSNLPISVALVWLTNPITMPPLFFLSYRVGALILGSAPQENGFEFTLTNLLASMEHYGKPFLFGCFIMAILSSLAGNLFVRLIWRHHVRKHWHNRKKKRLTRKHHH